HRARAACIVEGRREAAGTRGRRVREQSAGVGSAGGAGARSGNWRAAVRVEEGAEAESSRTVDLTYLTSYAILPDVLARPRCKGNESLLRWLLSNFFSLRKSLLRSFSKSSQSSSVTQAATSTGWALYPLVEAAESLAGSK